MNGWMNYEQQSNDGNTTIYYDTTRIMKFEMWDSQFELMRTVQISGLYPFRNVSECFSSLFIDATHQ